jgi:hypothetical protein
LSKQQAHRKVERLLRRKFNQDWLWLPTKNNREKRGSAAMQSEKLQESSG